MKVQREPDELTTQLLRKVSAREEGAEDQLYALVYDVLHGLARRQMAGQPADHTLQPTALVHEAWLRMSAGEGLSTRDQRHFLALASRAMRCALVDHARGRSRSKRGSTWTRKVLDEALESCMTQELDVLELDEALDKLRAQDERLARLVELRFFGGLTSHEAAEVLEISTGRAERDWRLARVFLRSVLSTEKAG